MTIDFRTARRSFIIYIQGQIMGQKVGNKNEEAILKRQSRGDIFFGFAWASLFLSLLPSFYNIESRHG